MKIWIFLDGRQQGPFEMEELLDMPVTENTKVWYEGLPKWYPAGYLDELKPLFDGSLAARSRSKAEAEINREEGPAVTVESEQADTRAKETVEEKITVEEPAAAEPPRNRYEEHPFRPMPTEPCPPTYLGLTIFLLICCCSPVSIAALVLSIMTSSAYSSGNMDKAKKFSEITAWLIMVSLALGFFSFFLWDLFF